MEVKLKIPVFVIAGNTVGKSNIRHDNTIIELVRDERNNDVYWSGQSVIKFDVDNRNSAMLKVWDFDTFAPFLDEISKDDLKKAILRSFNRNIILCSQLVNAELIQHVCKEIDDLQIIVIARPVRDLLSFAEKRGDIQVFGSEVIEQTWSSIENIVKWLEPLSGTDLEQRIHLTRIGEEEFLNGVLQKVLAETNWFELKDVK